MKNCNLRLLYPLFAYFHLLCLPCLLTIAFAASALAEAGDLTGSYIWKPMKIGGGGWVVGLDVHPTEQGLMYIRTDVSGAYRWDNANEEWQQLVTVDSMPTEYVAYGTYRGVDSLVGAPSAPNVAYMAYEGEIFRSTNRGDSWAPTGFKQHGVIMAPAGEGRQEGERLAVDPADSNVVYYGSISHGLWRTLNGGAFWSRVDAIPVGIANHGVNTVVFDPDSGVLALEGRLVTKALYASTDGQGIFKSTDAGRTWINIADGGPGAGARVRDAAIGPDRTYYVACDNVDGATGSVWKYTVEGSWKNITPQGGEAYWAVAVDPTDSDRLVVIVNGGKLFVSGDQGGKWTAHGFVLKSDAIDWLGKQDNSWLSVGECAFDQEGKLWFAEGFGVWWADSLEQPDIAWRAASKGIEETCGNDMIAPPGGTPLGAMWDVGVFRFPDPDAYTAERGIPYFMSAWALDWCAGDPQFIAGIFHNHNNFPPHINNSGYSTDGGRTWTVFPAVANATAPSELAYGVVAVAADNPDNIVWAGADNNLPYYTTDRGVTWQRSTFGEPATSGMNAIYSPLKPLAADRVLLSTFYFYRWEDGVYRSTDGGASFVKVGNPVSHRTNSTLKAAPGYAGHLWFAEGSQGVPVGGLWRSTDGGETWRELSGIEQAFNFGFGKAIDDESYLSIYVAGVREGGTTPGIWRSTDEGLTWDKISDYPLGIFDWIDAIDGDKEVFGKVYIAFTSSGFAYGELLDEGQGKE